MHLTDNGAMGPNLLNILVDPNQLEHYEDIITDRHLAAGDLRREQMDRDEYRRYVHDEWMKSVGPMPEHGLLSHRIVGKFELETLDTEIVALETRPGFFVSGTVYKPRNARGKLPGVLCVCGHSETGRLVEPYQRVASMIASAGMIVLAIDSYGQGNRIDGRVEGLPKPAFSCSWQRHDYAGAQCLLAGMTIGGVFVHDALCARDYLESRDDVQDGKIGVTGCSGGGTLTSMLMMHAPEKFAAAAPCCFISSRHEILASRRRQDTEQIWPGMVKSGLDHADALIAFSPRPVMLLTADADFFPIEGAIDSVEKARPFWPEKDPAHALEIFTDHALHSYSRPMAQQAAIFFAKQLLGETRTADMLRDEYLPQAAMDALENVYDKLGSRTVQHLAAEALEKAPKPEKERARAWLAPQLEKRDYPLFLKRKPQFDQAYDLRAEPVLWRLERDLYNFGVWFTPADGKVDRAVIGLWDGGTSRWTEHVEEAFEVCHAGGGYLMVDLTGTGSMADGLYTPENGDYWWNRRVVFDDTLLVNGDSMPAMRARGVARALEAVQALCGLEKADVIAYGRFALYAHMAKLCGCAIGKIEEKLPVCGLKEIVRNKYYDYNDIRAILLPGMLQYFDLNDLREWNQE